MSDDLEAPPEGSAKPAEVLQGEGDPAAGNAVAAIAENPVPVQPVAVSPLEPVFETIPPTLPAPPPIPGGVVFTVNGGAADNLTEPIQSRTKVYVQADGTKVVAKVAAQRRDGSFDLLLPSGTVEVRRDQVRTKQDENQTGDYVE